MISFQRKIINLEYNWFFRFAQLKMEKPIDQYFGEFYNIYSAVSLSY